MGGEGLADSQIGKEEELGRKMGPVAKEKYGVDWLGVGVLATGSW